MLNGRARVILHIDLMNTVVTYPGRGVVEGVRRGVIAGRCIFLRADLDRASSENFVANLSRPARARPHHRVIPQRHIDGAILEATAIPSLGQLWYRDALVPRSRSLFGLPMSSAARALCSRCTGLYEAAGRRARGLAGLWATCGEDFMMGADRGSSLAIFKD